MEAICHQYNFVLKNSTSFKIINSSCSWTCLVLACPTLLLNLLLIISLAKSRDMSKSCGLLILNLAITDLLNGLFNMPLFYTVFGFIAEGKDPCQFVNIAMPCFIAATSESFIIVTLIAVERYISVLHPFVHVSKLSKRNVTICVAISWISSIFVIIPLLVGENVARMNGFFTAVGVVGTVVNIYCYLRVLLKARKTRLQIRNETARFNETNITSTDKRFLFIGGLIIISMFVSFLMVVLASLLPFLGFELMKDIRCWKWTLVMANSLVNPIITCTFCPCIRREILKILLCSIMCRETNS